MDRLHDILNSINHTLSEHKSYDGKKRSDLKDSDFLFPETRSFPIVSPQDVKNAISNYGRMKGNMTYEAFLHKLYNFCKRKGPEFVAALPEASKEKLNMKTKSDDFTNDGDIFELNQVDDDNAGDQEDSSMDSYDNEFFDMSVAAIRDMMNHCQAIIAALDDPQVQSNLTASWQQGKISTAADHMKSIHDFVMPAVANDDTSTDAGSKPGLWDNIRKKKERMGKNYRPAKPGDKDYPDKDAFKKAEK